MTFTSNCTFEEMYITLVEKLQSLMRIASNDGHVRDFNDLPCSTNCYIGNKDTAELSRKDYATAASVYEISGTKANKCITFVIRVGAKRTIADTTAGKTPVKRTAVTKSSIYHVNIIVTK